MSKILLAAMFAAAIPVAANAGLSDGSFEIKGAALPVTDYCYDGFATPGGPACAPGAWTGNGVIKSGSGAWGGTTTPAGSYYGFVQGASSLSQSFVADSSGGFSLSWLDAGRTNNGGPQTYEVTITDNGVTERGTFALLSPSTSLGTFTTNGSPFTLRTGAPFSLIAGDGYTLSFTGLVDADVTSFIDGVTLTAVPEPATWGLMLAGFALVGVAAHRRQGALAA